MRTSISTKCAACSTGSAFSAGPAAAATSFFHHPDLPEIINLQPRHGKGKPYQMKQVRELILRYHLTATYA